MVHKSQFQSNQVPKYIPEDVHNNTLVLLCFIPYGLPKVQLPYIETEKVCNYQMLLFLFYNWGSKDVLPLIVVRGRRKGPNKMFQKKLDDYGPHECMALFQKRRKKL
jgi:hypothetical protein